VAAHNRLNKPVEVKLWDVATGREILTLRGLGSEVTKVEFSPDGTRLAASGPWIWDGLPLNETPL
jgi:WD40 repeat protein